MTASELLCRYEWTIAGPPPLRLFFRRDGTGFYERKEASGRLVREKFLYRFDADRLELKFAHARDWTEVAASIRAGHAPAGERVGEHELVVARDPYAFKMEDRLTSELVFESDAGAALPSS